MTLKMKTADGYLNISGKVNIVDSLESDSDSKALSAKQGKILNSKITTLLQTMYDMIYPVGDTFLGFQQPKVPEGVTATWEEQKYDNKIRMIALDTGHNPGTLGGSEKHKHALGYNGGAAIAWSWSAQDSNMLLGITGDASSCGVSFQSSSRMPSNGYVTEYRNNVTCVPLRGNTEESNAVPLYLTIKVWKRKT